MREILFRGKDIAGNWHYGVPLVFTEDYVCMTAPHTYNKAVIPETVGQYTGLTDKNGKKIFEGDIVEVTYLTRCYDNETEIREVTYNEEECCYYPMRWNETCEVCDYFTEIQSIEIIGNIHDNPELLKGGEG